MTYNDIFEILLQLLVLIVGGLLIPYIKTKIGETRYAKILANVNTAVEAAEQIYKTMEKGEHKNQLRYEEAVKYLSKKGIKLSEEELKAMIHAAVLRLNEAIR